MTYIAGSTAEDFYGVPDVLKEKCLTIVTSEMKEIIMTFEELSISRKTEDA